MWGDAMEDSERIRCRCGRFARHPQPIYGSHSRDPYLADVVNDCTKCGPGTPTGRGWWLSWDAWDPEAS